MTYLNGLTLRLVYRSLSLRLISENCLREVVREYLLGDLHFERHGLDCVLGALIVIVIVILTLYLSLCGL